MSAGGRGGYGFRAQVRDYCLRSLYISYPQWKDVIEHCALSICIVIGIYERRKHSRTV